MTIPQIPVYLWTNLSNAAKNNEIDNFLRIAMPYGGNKIQDEYGWTPLHYATRYGSDEMVKRLLENGAAHSINVEDNGGWTPLHTATRYGSDEMVKRLLESGAAQSINDINNYGSTPLHYATRYGSYEMVKHLLENGADKSINVATNYGLTPLHIAAEYADIDTIRHLWGVTDQTPRQILSLYSRHAVNNGKLNQDDRQLLYPYTLESQIQACNIEYVTATLSFWTAISIIFVVQFTTLPIPLIVVPMTTLVVAIILSGIRVRAHVLACGVKPEYQPSLVTPINVEACLPQATATHTSNNLLEREVLFVERKIDHRIPEADWILADHSKCKPGKIVTIAAPNAQPPSYEEATSACTN